MSSKALPFSLRKMDGEKCRQDWTSDIMGCKVTVSSSSKMKVKLTVNNVMVDRKILNIFGVIKGFEEPGNSSCIVAQSLRGTLPLLCSL